MIALEHAVKRRSWLRRRSIKCNESAEFHSASARVVIRMRYVRRASAPDDGSNPRKSHNKHVGYSTKHKDLNSAKARRESCEARAKNPIGHAKKHPRDEARSQQITWHAPEAKYGDQCDESKKTHGRQIARKGKAIEKGNAIGHDDPAAKHDRKSDPDVDTHTDRCVPENVERTIRGQMFTSGHQATLSQDRR